MMSLGLSSWGRLFLPESLLVNYTVFRDSGYWLRTRESALGGGFRMRERLLVRWLYTYSYFIRLSSLSKLTKSFSITELISLSRATETTRDLLFRSFPGSSCISG